MDSANAYTHSWHIRPPIRRMPAATSMRSNNGAGLGTRALAATTDTDARAIHLTPPTTTGCGYDFSGRPPIIWR